MRHGRSNAWAACAVACVVPCLAGCAGFGAKQEEPVNQREFWAGEEQTLHDGVRQFKGEIRAERERRAAFAERARALRARRPVFSGQ